MTSEYTHNNPSDGLYKDQNLLEQGNRASTGSTSEHCLELCKHHDKLMDKQTALIQAHCSTAKMATICPEYCTEKITDIAAWAATYKACWFHRVSLGAELASNTSQYDFARSTRHLWWSAVKSKPALGTCTDMQCLSATSRFL